MSLTYNFGKLHNMALTPWRLQFDSSFVALSQSPESTLQPLIHTFSLIGGTQTLEAALSQHKCSLTLNVANWQSLSLVF